MRSHALVIGKFYPPHRGHQLLVDTAAAECELVTVLVMGSATESIPLTERAGWVRQVHADQPGVAVVPVRCDIISDYASEQAWTANVDLMRAAVRGAGRPIVTRVYSSEPYGDELAARLGAEHRCVDEGRFAVPVSATAVRADPRATWDLLPPLVRADLAVRVIVLGSESTGTTTLARQLAEHYQAPWVPEYGREVSVDRLHALQTTGRTATMDAICWTEPDFVRIAAEQARQEDAAALGAGLVIGDTDALATAVWFHRYTGGDPAGLVVPDQPRARTLYLLTDHRGVPFEQDGYRDGEGVREQMTTWFEDHLLASGATWIKVTGSPAERFCFATANVDAFIAASWSFSAPLLAATAAV
jgi:HTH-type transcriptional regulator, transcriptional repressor of NAD biosynthesis genes